MACNSYQRFIYQNKLSLHNVKIIQRVSFIVHIKLYNQKCIHLCSLTNTYVENTVSTLSLSGGSYYHLAGIECLKSNILLLRVMFTAE